MASASAAKATREFGGIKHELSAIVYSERFSDKLRAASISCTPLKAEAKEKNVGINAFMIYDKSLFWADTVREATHVTSAFPPSANSQLCRTLSSIPSSNFLKASPHKTAASNRSSHLRLTFSLSTGSFLLNDLSNPPSNTFNRITRN